MSKEALAELAAQCRMDILSLSFKAKTPHLGSALSVVEILIACMETLEITPENAHTKDRDYLIFSKGHACLALYTIFKHYGLLSQEQLASFNQPKSLLAEQPLPFAFPGLEVATGSLGHGLPVALGIALGMQTKSANHKVIAILSDGECNEGTVWEAAMMAAARKLENLVVVVDYNKWQATGRSQEILQIEPFSEKWRSFGWASIEVEGHNIKNLTQALKSEHHKKPLAIIAHTVKGKGVSFMEDDNNWHYRIPTAIEVAQAKEELFS